jgi:hypothetical protein
MNSALFSARDRLTERRDSERFYQSTLPRLRDRTYFAGVYQIGEV